MTAPPAAPSRNAERLRGALGLVFGELVRAGSRFVDDPQIRERYPEYLVMCHTVIRASVPLMEAARENARELAPGDPVAAELVDYLTEHIEEERDHDEWLLRDLEAIGVARGEGPPGPPPRGDRRAAGRGPAASALAHGRRRRRRAVLLVAALPPVRDPRLDRPARGIRARAGDDRPPRRAHGLSAGGVPHPAAARRARRRPRGRALRPRGPPGVVRGAGERHRRERDDERPLPRARARRGARYAGCSAISTIRPMSSSKPMPAASAA